MKHVRGRGGGVHAATPSVLPFSENFIRMGKRRDQHCLNHYEFTTARVRLSEGYQNLALVSWEIFLS